ncbi:MAG: Single-stranded DNA-binding protein [Microgenomates group bacterium GW2011_GWF1_38_5]|nr:MAG: Single-stranded DNA-binding protein [Microgenomates group bacterium GW2011_GWF1_38_5]
MSRSLNKVELIGNLTRDPELRFTPSGAAVCSFGLATNRQWNTDSGEKKEEVEFHRIVAWNKLAELCGQLLAKGRKVYVEGRLQTRRWTGQDNLERTTTEIVISDMIILDSRAQFEAAKSNDVIDVPENLEEIVPPVADDAAPANGTPSKTNTGSKVSTLDNKKNSVDLVNQDNKKDAKDDKKEKEVKAEEVDDDIPF